MPNDKRIYTIETELSLPYIKKENNQHNYWAGYVVQTEDNYILCKQYGSHYFVYIPYIQPNVDRVSVFLDQEDAKFAITHIRSTAHSIAKKAYITDIFVTADIKEV